MTTARVPESILSYTSVLSVREVRCMMKRMLCSTCTLSLCMRRVVDDAKVAIMQNSCKWYPCHGEVVVLPCDGHPKCACCEGGACGKRRGTRSVRTCASEMVVLSAHGGSASFSSRRRKSTMAGLGTVYFPQESPSLSACVEANSNDTEPP